MSRGVCIILLAGLSVFGTGCGAARKARQARKLEAARRTDSLAALKRAWAEVAAQGQPDTMQLATPRTDTIETAALDPAKTTVPAYFLSLHGRTTPFQTFSGKAKMEYETGGGSKEFTAAFRVRRDSAIWVSVVAVGGLVPVARILVTPDSVLYINYLTREASRLEIADAAALLPLPAKFSQLQALLLGDALEPTAPIVSTGKAEGLPLYYVSTRSEAAMYTTYYNAGDTTLEAEELRANDRSVSTKVRYSHYEASSAGRFSMEREVLIETLTVGDTLVRYVLSMRFTDPPRFDAPLEFSFSIPKNYSLK